MSKVTIQSEVVPENLGKPRVRLSSLSMFVRDLWQAGKPDPQKLFGLRTTECVTVNAESLMEVFCELPQCQPAVAHHVLGLPVHLCES